MHSSLPEGKMGRFALLLFDMRVGLFGGTFDPPHRGHLAVARAAKEAFGLGRVLLAPTGRQPLKAAGAVASFADRLAMVQALCSENRAGAGGIAELEASTLDAPRQDGEPNYTIDAIRTLQLGLLAAYPESGGDTVFVIAGADAFRHLHKWRQPDALLSEAEWIVVSRPGVPCDDLAVPGLTADQLRRVHQLRGVREPASSTEVRRRLRAGADASELLTPGVLDYICEHGLYGCLGVRGGSL